MAPGDFDDVRFRFLEEPEPPREPRRPRHRRKAAVGAATVLVVGALAAGTSALAGSNADTDGSRPAAAKGAQTKGATGSDARDRQGRKCRGRHGGERFGGASSSASQL